MFNNNAKSNKIEKDHGMHLKRDIYINSTLNDENIFANFQKHSFKIGIYTY